MRRLLVLFVAILATGACSESPVEQAIGPSTASIDSAAWRERMASRPSGLMLSESMTDCATACNFAPTNYHCGGPKAECSFQGEPIFVTPQNFVPRTLVISGSGALLCNSTMGQVVAYDASDAVVATVDLVPIDPGDCGTDNITFGGTATLSWDPGIAYIVIGPPAPWTFPVEGGGTGIASAFYTVQMNDEAIPFTVSCPATPTRASSITCTATKTNPASDATVTGWRWVAADGGRVITRSTGQTSLTWTGKLVATGHVEVTSSINGHAFPVAAVSNTMTAQARDWSGLSTLKTVTLVSPNSRPVQPIDAEGQLGETTSGINVLPGIDYFETLADGGPNDSYTYYTGVPWRITHDIEINASMLPGHPFYNLQYNDPGRKGSLPHGIKIWWCGKSRVSMLQTIIEAHEGTQSQAASHIGFYDRVTDSLMRVEVERVADPDGGPVGLLESVRSRALAASAAYDSDPLNNYKIDTEQARQVIFPDNYRCRFKYF